MTRLGRLDIAGAGPDVLARWQKPLGRSARACGCQEGAVAVLVALLALVLCAINGVVVDWLVNETISWIATVFAAALLGKLAGLAWAALRLRRLATAIERWEAAR